MMQELDSAESTWSQVIRHSLASQKQSLHVFAELLASLCRIDLRNLKNAYETVNTLVLLFIHCLPAYHAWLVWTSQEASNI